MLILHVAYVNPQGSLGGLERMVLDLGAAQRRRQDCNVVFAVNEGVLAEAARSNRYTVNPLTGRKSLAAIDAWRLGTLIKRLRPDVVHSHHRMTTFLLSLLPARHTPVVHTEHLWRRNRRRWFRPGDFCCCVHPSITDNLASHYRVPRSKLVTVQNAVPGIEVDQEKAAALRAALPGPSDALLVLVPARLEPEKGHRYLLQALARMSPPQRCRLRVVMAGDGSQRPALRAQIQRLGLGDRVQLAGYRGDIHVFMAACDIVVLPSLQEGMPLVLLEAQQLGKPVIASDLPGTRDAPGPVRLVAPADPVELAEALAEALDEPRPTAAGNAPLRTHEAMVDDYLRVYRDVIAKSAR